MLKRYGEWIVRFRWLVLLLSVASVLFLASGGRFLAFTNDYRVWFSEDNPELIRFENLQESYTRSDNILVMLEPKSGEVFSRETLTAVADLTDRAWQVPFSVRVDSLSNFQHIYGEEDDLIVEDLVEDLLHQSAHLQREDVSPIRVVQRDDGVAFLLLHQHRVHAGPLVV